MCKARDVPGFVVFAAFPRRRCAWTGYSLVVRPVGWVARARHLCRPRESLQGPDAKRARTCVRALISNMAVRGGLTRFARRYSAHPWASPLRGQRRRCSKTLPAFLSGQPAYCVRGLSNWLRQLSNPGRGFSSPPYGEYKRKEPVLSYELLSRIWR